MLRGAQSWGGYPTRERRRHSGGELPDAECSPVFAPVQGLEVYPYHRTAPSLGAYTGAAAPQGDFSMLSALRYRPNILACAATRATPSPSGSVTVGRRGGR